MSDLHVHCLCNVFSGISTHSSLKSESSAVDHDQWKGSCAFQTNSNATGSITLRLDYSGSRLTLLVRRFFGDLHLAGPISTDNVRTKRPIRRSNMEPSISHRSTGLFSLLLVIRCLGPNHSCLGELP
jgi:hypothetical protein